MAFKSIMGRMLGLTEYGNLAAKGGDIQVTPVCADCTITIGAEGASVANQRAITIQFKDANGNDMQERVRALAFVFGDANGDSISTGGSTGVAAGTDGFLTTLVAKTAFVLHSEADGDWDGTYTDTGTAAAYLGVLLPTGRMVISDAMTNA